MRAGALRSRLVAGWRTLRLALLSVRVLLGRRAWLFLVADLLVLSGALIMALVGGSHPGEMHALMVMLPTLLLAVPLMADCVAVERRAGTLDLALTSPSAFYFERRILVATGLATLQGTLILTVLHAGHRQGFPWLATLVHVAVWHLLVGSLVLFWAVRLHTTGAVATAVFACVVPFLPWISDGPFEEGGATFPPWTGASTWALHATAILATAAALWLYSKRRLSRPELIIR